MRKTRASGMLNQVAKKNTKNQVGQRSQPAPSGSSFGHGGRREGAGRKRTTNSQQCVAHRTRVDFRSARPIHVTIRFAQDVGSLRHRKRYQILMRVFQETDVHGFRLCHFSVQSNHLHLIVEASNRARMTSGMKSINARIGIYLNALMGRETGRIIADRYHEEHLTKPRQVRDALAYVLNNSRRHTADGSGEKLARGCVDPCSSGDYFDGWKGRTSTQIHSGAPVTAPRTQLLKTLWRRHGLIDIDSIPDSAGRSQA